MLALASGLVAIFALLRTPALFFWRVTGQPLVVLCYRAYLFIKKILRRVAAWCANLVDHVIKSRHVMHVAVITLSLLVTATNIAASGQPAMSDTGAPKSILAQVTQGTESEVYVDDQASDPNAMSASSEGAVAAGQQDSTDGDTQYTDDSSQTADIQSGNVAYSSPFDQGVSAEPGEAVGTAAPSAPAAPADQVAEATVPTIQSYTVQDGDTIAGIALKFGVKMSTIFNANNLGASGFIKPGQTLRIPPVDGLIYSIRKGDTLARIAANLKADPDEIAAANNLDVSGKLVVGTDIVVPGGQLPPTPKPPRRLASSIRDVFIPPPAASHTADGIMLWPTAVRRITQYFRGLRHTGVDIAGPIGTPIYAANDGIVAVAGWNTGGYGNMIIVDHGGGVFTRYGHASKLLVQAGDTVKKGDVIALMGTTGHSTGPHLHFEVMLRTVHNRVNPLEYVR